MMVLFPCARVYHVLSRLILPSLLVQESATEPTILNGVTCYVIKIWGFIFLWDFNKGRFERPQSVMIAHDQEIIRPWSRVCLGSEASVTNFISLWQNRFRFFRPSLVWAVSPECPFFECLRWKRRTCLLLTGRRGKVTRTPVWNAKVPLTCFCVENQIYK